MRAGEARPKSSLRLEIALRRMRRGQSIEALGSGRRRVRVGDLDESIDCGSHYIGQPGPRTAICRLAPLNRVGPVRHSQETQPRDRGAVGQFNGINFKIALWITRGGAGEYSAQLLNPSPSVPDFCLRMNQHIDYYTAPGRKPNSTPSAFVGWETIVGGSPEWGVVSGYRLFRGSWMFRWALAFDDLDEAFVTARNQSSWISAQLMNSSLRIYGLNSLGFQAYDSRGQWPGP